MSKSKCIMFCLIFCIIILLPIISKADDEIVWIKNAEELKAFADNVNNGNSYEGITVKLQNDIELNCNENNQWKPIGWCTVSGGNNVSSADSESKSAFKGTFDGNNYYISGVYIKNEENFMGLFGVNEGTIQNLTLKDSYIESNQAYSAGITAYNSGDIINCVNYAKVINNSTAGASGGIVGYSGSIVIGDSIGAKIIQCSNYGDVIGTTGFLGGCTGYARGTHIYKCYNNATIGSNSYGAGGIAGFAQTSEVVECYNAGTIIADYKIGGIVGEIYKFANLKYCYNIGEVSNTGNENNAMIGGISGSIALNDSRYCFKNCYNIGNVSKNNTETCTEVYIGNISGVYEGGTISNCYYLKNQSNITGIGKGMEDANGVLENKTIEELKDSNFINALNAGITEEDISSVNNERYNLYNEKGQAFIYDKNSINNGYPIFYWEKIRTSGDINEDNKIDVTDLLLIKRHIVSGSKTEWKLTDKEIVEADINKDGKVDVTDLLLVKRHIVSGNKEEWKIK